MRRRALHLIGYLLDAVLVGRHRTEDASRPATVMNLANVKLLVIVMRLEI